MEIWNIIQVTLFLLLITNVTCKLVFECKKSSCLMFWVCNLISVVCNKESQTITHRLVIILPLKWNLITSFINRKGKWRLSRYKIRPQGTRKSCISAYWQLMNFNFYMISKIIIEYPFYHSVHNLKKNDTKHCKL